MNSPKSKAKPKPKPQASRRRTGVERPTLPPVTMGRFEDAMGMVERLFAEHTTTFLQHGQAYKDQHREGSRRPLAAVEVAQIAAGLGTTLQDAQAQIVEAGLTAYDEPQASEVLAAMVVASGVALLSTAQRITALFELPEDEFERAVDDDRLDQVLDESAAGWRRLSLAESRARATAVLSHLAAAAGVDTVDTFKLVGNTVWQGLQSAGEQMQTNTPSVLVADRAEED